MSIEVANESGVGVDETALVSVSRYVLDRMGINPLAELSILLMDVAGDDRAARQVDGRTRSRPT